MKFLKKFDNGHEHCLCIKRLKIQLGINQKEPPPLATHKSGRNKLFLGHGSLQSVLLNAFTIIFMLSGTLNWIRLSQFRRKSNIRTAISFFRIIAWNINLIHLKFLQCKLLRNQGILELSQCEILSKDLLPTGLGSGYWRPTTSNWSSILIFLSFWSLNDVIKWKIYLNRPGLKFFK